MFRIFAGMFYEKELQKTNRQEFRAEKVINRKSDKLYVKWKGGDNPFNSWIDNRHGINKLMFPKIEIFRRKHKSWIRFI